MGDRANIAVKASDKDTVFLYSHWNGSELPDQLQAALRRKQRWDDGAYLARIIFAEMTKGHENGETGFGISATVGDGDDRVLLVDVEGQTVTVSHDDEGTLRPRSEPVKFDAYIADDYEPTWAD